MTFVTLVNTRAHAQKRTQKMRRASAGYPSAPPLQHITARTHTHTLARIPYADWLCSDADNVLAEPRPDAAALARHR